MNTDQAKDILKDVIRQVQEQGGAEAHALTDDVCPLRDLEGFDSLIGLVATGYVADTIGCNIPNGVNLFVEEDHQLTLIDAAQKLCDTLGSVEATSIE